MRTLIVYYSRTGNTGRVAEELKNRLSCDIEEIKTEKSYDGPIGWVRAGKESSQKVRAKIKPAIKNPADYDLLILGTPIWAWDISSPLRGYIAMNKDKFKKLAAFCTMGLNAGQAFEEIEEICGRKLEATAAFKDKDVLADNFEGIKNFL